MRERALFSILAAGSIGVIALASPASGSPAPSAAGPAERGGLDKLETITLPADPGGEQGASVLSKTIFENGERYEFRVSGHLTSSRFNDVYDAFYVETPGCGATPPDDCVTPSPTLKADGRDAAVVLNRSVYPEFNGSHGYTLSTEDLSDGPLVFSHNREPLTDADTLTGSFTIEVYGEGARLTTVRFKLIQEGRERRAPPNLVISRTIAAGDVTFAKRLKDDGEFRKGTVGSARVVHEDDFFEEEPFGFYTTRFVAEDPWDRARYRKDDEGPKRGTSKELRLPLTVTESTGECYPGRIALYLLDSPDRDAVEFATRRDCPHRHTWSAKPGRKARVQVNLDESRPQRSRAP